MPSVASARASRRNGPRSGRAERSGGLQERGRRSIAFHRFPGRRAPARADGPSRAREGAWPAAPSASSCPSRRAGRPALPGRRRRRFSAGPAGCAERPRAAWDKRCAPRRAAQPRARPCASCTPCRRSRWDGARSERSWEPGAGTPAPSSPSACRGCRSPQANPRPATARRASAARRRASASRRPASPTRSDPTTVGGDIPRPIRGPTSPSPNRSRRRSSSPTTESRRGRIRVPR